MEGKPAPTSSNPQDYARAVRVEDDEVLLLKTQRDEKFRHLYRLQMAVEVAQAELTALRERTFLRLDELYPAIRRIDPDSGVGIREWQDDVWYVGWDGAQE
jgi:hypothetical protein